MSIALKWIGRPAFATACLPILEAAAAAEADGARFTPPPRVEAGAACSSSIGRDCGCSAAAAGGGEDEDEDEDEVQSRLKSPLERMDVLEDALPTRQGISKFYCGKSKSFMNLSEATPTSVKDPGKPENSYTRKRKNLIAFGNKSGRPHDNLMDFTGGGTPKRLTNSNRSTSSLTCTTSSSGSNSPISEEEEHDPSGLLLPLHPQCKPVAASPCSFPQHRKSSCPLKSFSMTDLQGVAGSSSPFSPRHKHKIFC